MPDLIQPHGGGVLVNRTVPADQVSNFKLKVPCTTSICVSDGDLSMLYRIADGGLSPLVGPMTKEEFDRVLDEEVIVNNGKKYAWTIPMAFPVDEATAKKLTTGSLHPLTTEHGQVVGTILVKDVYAWDKAKYYTGVFGTTRNDNPGVIFAMEERRTMLVGGEVNVLSQPKNPQIGSHLLSPRESRDLFKKLGYKRVVGLQSRNLGKQANGMAQAKAFELLMSEGKSTGVVFNFHDVESTKMLLEVIDNKSIGQVDRDESLLLKSQGKITDQIHMLGFEMKNFRAGPKETVMNAIYLQNFGYTDMVIGSAQPDATLDAIKGELKIHLLKV